MEENRIQYVVSVREQISKHITQKLHKLLRKKRNLKEQWITLEDLVPYTLDDLLEPLSSSLDVTEQSEHPPFNFECQSSSTPAQRYSYAHSFLTSSSAAMDKQNNNLSMDSSSSSSSSTSSSSSSSNLTYPEAGATFIRRQLLFDLERIILQQVFKETHFSEIIHRLLHTKDEMAQEVLTAFLLNLNRLFPQADDFLPVEFLTGIQQWNPG